MFESFMKYKNCRTNYKNLEKPLKNIQVKWREEAKWIIIQKWNTKIVIKPWKRKEKQKWKRMKEFFTTSVTCEQWTSCDTFGNAWPKRYVTIVSAAHRINILLIKTIDVCQNEIYLIRKSFFVRIHSLVLFSFSIRVTDFVMWSCCPSFCSIHLHHLDF